MQRRPPARWPKLATVGLLIEQRGLGRQVREPVATCGSRAVPGLGSSRPAGVKRVAQLVDADLGLFRGGEVPAVVDFVPVHDVGPPVALAARLAANWCERRSGRVASAWRARARPRSPSLRPGLPIARRTRAGSSAQTNAGNSQVVPARLAWSVGEPESWERGNDHVKRVLGRCAVFDWVDEGSDAVQELHDRPWPTRQRRREDRGGE